MLFTINNKDYTNHIIADSYKINSEEIYESFEDAKRKRHNVLVRNKVQGSMDLFFKTMSEYDDFLADWEQGKDKKTNAHRVFLKPNNLRGEGDYYVCFLEQKPTRRLNGRYEEYIGQVTLSVEER